jgi:hypothetical protein
LTTKIVRPISIGASAAALEPHAIAAAINAAAHKHTEDLCQLRRIVDRAPIAISGLPDGAA